MLHFLIIGATRRRRIEEEAIRGNCPNPVIPPPDFRTVQEQMREKYSEFFCAKTTGLCDKVIYVLEANGKKIMEDGECDTIDFGLDSCKLLSKNFEGNNFSDLKNCKFNKVAKTATKVVTTLVAGALSFFYLFNRG